MMDGLCRVLIDCVEGGASVSFMPPLTLERARGFWRKVADDVAYVPGAPFFPAAADARTLRLGFPTLTPERIEQGVARLGRVFAAALAESRREPVLLAIR